MAKAAVRAHSAPLPTLVQDCPVLDGSTEKQFRESVKSANAFSLGVLDWLKGRSAKQQAAWLKVSVSSSREFFQPWSMEIVFVLATLGRARFTELQELLGLSSRTLSDKLKSLREAGMLERHVFDEQPVRIEYTLTKAGRRTAALASPLFAHLGLQAIDAAKAAAPRA